MTARNKSSSDIWRMGTTRTIWSENCYRIYQRMLIYIKILIRFLYDYSSEYEINVCKKLRPHQVSPSLITLVLPWCSSCYFKFQIILNILRNRMFHLSYYTLKKNKLNVVCVPLALYFSYSSISFYGTYFLWIDLFLLSVYKFSWCFLHSLVFLVPF